MNLVRKIMDWVMRKIDRLIKWWLT